jgi:CheY-like chemotaxis protein
LTVLADPVILEQAILNICVNAAHAMTSMRDKATSTGGILSVMVDHTELTADALQSRPGKKPGSWWCISIKDTGVGIPAQIQQKIFEPFYTTKPTGQGTGLGLSTTWSIIEQHDGFLQLYSETGKGSIFHLWLPAVDTSQITSETTSISEIPTGQGLILVVDDEDIVRRTAQALLERCGYQVVTAENGNDAIKLHENWKSSIRAILLDLTMPGMSGHETLRAIRDNDPQACVVISSGFHDPDEIDALVKDGAAGFIGKPYSIASLARGLDEAIQRVHK